MNKLFQKFVVSLVVVSFAWALTSCCCREPFVHADTEIKASSLSSCHSQNPTASETSKKTSPSPCGCKNLVLLQAENFSQGVGVFNPVNFKPDTLLVKSFEGFDFLSAKVFYESPPKTLQKSVPTYLFNRVLRI